jgi:hypothetical protein
MMDPLWCETCWSGFKYFIILIVSTYYILCIGWIINCLNKLELTHFCIDLAIQLLPSAVPLYLTSTLAINICRQKTHSIWGTSGLTPYLSKHKSNTHVLHLVHVLAVLESANFGGFFWATPYYNVMGSIPDGVIGIFHWQNPSVSLWPSGSLNLRHKWELWILSGE